MAEDDSTSLLAEHRLDRQGIHIKLDCGFEDGTYGIYIEFGEMAQRGFAQAHRAASDYAEILRSQLIRIPGVILGPVDNPSRHAAPGRRRDLEMTFLSFPVSTPDGHYHDDQVREAFKVAFLRAGQAWDQVQARELTHRRHTRQDRFREQLVRLLDGPAYAHLDAATKERLLAEIPALAVSTRGPG